MKHQAVLGLYTAAVQARALYESLRADQCRQRQSGRLRRGTVVPNKTLLYSSYMAGQKAANKRIFHLVYRREGHSGGIGYDGPDHLKNQIINFAVDCSVSRESSRRSVRCSSPMLSWHLVERWTRQPRWPPELDCQPDRLTADW